jgi:predicted DNA-binding protein (MmcQ/YjbR family)
MDAEQARAFLLSLPHVVETEQWGSHLLFWVGDKAIGGKMFVVANLEGDGKAVISFCAGPQRYAELLEIEGIIPAPYMARNHWVAVERWDVFRRAAWEAELRAAHAIKIAKLSPATRKLLALPVVALQRAVAAKKAALAAREATPSQKASRSG